jgi:hypothetical protein
MKKNDERRPEPDPQRGVFPGTPAPPEVGPGILPGTLAEKRERDESRRRD